MQKKTRPSKKGDLGSTPGNLMSSAREVLIRFTVLKDCSSCKVGWAEGTRMEEGQL